MNETLDINFLKWLVNDLLTHHHFKPDGTAILRLRGIIAAYNPVTATAVATFNKQACSTCFTQTPTVQQ